MEQDFEDRPAGGLEELPCAGRKDKCVPGCDGQRADEEVLVSAEMWRKIERVGQRERRCSHADGSVTRNVRVLSFLPPSWLIPQTAQQPQNPQQRQSHPRRAHRRRGISICKLSLLSVASIDDEQRHISCYTLSAALRFLCHCSQVLHPATSVSTTSR